MSAQSEADALWMREAIIHMLEAAGSGHAGGALGTADILAVLYRDVLKHRPTQPDWSLRDRFLLSNGHICPVLYAALALHHYFPGETLQHLRKLGSPLQGHPHAGSLPGIEMTAGPLGQGLSQAVGRGLALKLAQNPAHIFAMLSDGEHQEGQTWEAYMAGAHYQLDNVTAIIDRNFIQISGVTEQIMSLESLPAKLAAFGWSVYEVHGHDHEALKSTLLSARADGRPSAVVCYTEPGHGVSFMEAKYSWHGASVSPDQARQALRQLHSLHGRVETEYE